MFQSGRYFNSRVFWYWIFNSLVHSVICFMFCKSAYGLGVEWGSGGSGGYLVLGNIAYSCVMIIVNVKAGLEFVSWSWPTHAAIWGSIGKSSKSYNNSYDCQYISASIIRKVFLE